MKVHEKMGQLGAGDLGVATTKQKIPIWLFYTIRFSWVVWQNFTSTEIVKYGHAVQSLYCFILRI